MSEFDSRYAVLNKAQKKVVDSIDGPVMVIAGPGTGKTTILTLRIGNILRETDTAPENILALTFTESGAYAMRRKLLEAIGPAAYKVNIHTFHSFAALMIERYPDYFSRIIGSTVITEAEQIKIVEDIVASKDIKLLRPYGDPGYYVKPILNEIRILKRENIAPAVFRKSLRPGMTAGKRAKKETATEAATRALRDVKNGELAMVYARYEDHLAKEKYYDFDDMLLELIRAMERDRTFKLILQETYHYILADEHQDSNASQNRILELLADFHASPNLFIVGDDKQAIYRFQGASLENFLYFSKKYRGTKVIDLEHNYRSNQGILDAAHSLIEHNPAIPERSRARLKSLKMGTKPIRVAEFKTNEDELEYVATEIGRLLEKGEKGEEIAVIYRLNREASEVSSALRAHGIVHRIESDHNILSDIDSVKLVILSRAIADPSDGESLGEALFLPELGCDSGDVAELCELSRREKKPLHRLIKIKGKAADPKIAAAYARIAAWSAQARLLPFPEFLEKLIREVDLLGGIAADPDSLERLSSLEALFDWVNSAARSRRSFFLADFLEYIGIMSAHGIMSKRSAAEPSAGVRLMTAHGAKGLEFDHVFIVNAVDGVWGNRTRRSYFSVPLIEHARDLGRIEDERRLFYVAMTRARQEVRVSYALITGQKETLPSQFISEIDPSLVVRETPSVPARHELFARKMSATFAAPSVSILDPGFVGEKFLGQPLSVTHLNNYLECPWRYFFVNLIRVPQAQTKHQMYGTAVHAALRAFFEAYREERDFPKKELIAIFRHHLEMQAMSVGDRAESLEKGKHALEGYYRAYYPKWNRHLSTEYVLKGAEIDLRGLGHAKSGRLELTGKLDKIEFLDDRNAVVVDYKTSRPKSRNEIEGKTRGADGNYKRQLVFYKLLSSAQDKFVMKYGEIDFIEPNERGKYKKERFEIGDGEVAELEGIIKKMAGDITGLSFAEKGCVKKDCDYCRLGKVLLSHKGRD